MIDHVIVTVSDLAKSKAFYERALAPLAMKTTPEFPWGATGARGVGFGGEDIEFFVVEGSPIKPPIHVAFRAATRAEVQAFHREALAAGGRDNGAPELSPEHHADYFSAYVFDPDGYNIEAVCTRRNSGLPRQQLDEITAMRPQKRPPTYYQARCGRRLLASTSRAVDALITCSYIR